MNESTFAHDTAVERVPVPGSGERATIAFRANLSERWWVFKGPNGGYVAAVLTRAVLEASEGGSRRPRSVTIHYLARPRAGACEIEVTVEREGRTLTFTSVRLVQDGAVKALGLVVLGGDRGDAVEFQDVTMPVVPPPEECPTLADLAGTYVVPAEISARYEIRPALGEVPGSASGERALTGAWIRFTEPYVPDSLFVVAAADGMPPAVLTRHLHGSRLFGVPTVDLTIHLHEPLPLPQAGVGDWCFAVFRTKKSRAGLLDEDGEIWSRGGLLLAQSRQHALPQ
ncbi:MAG: thioesterase family protein [Acidimicrobiia bacterium]|nr:thioesterase family protein [Acidimicrobiia bacterium]